LKYSTENLTYNEKTNCSIFYRKEELLRQTMKSITQGKILIPYNKNTRELKSIGLKIMRKLKKVVSDLRST
jgi:hypothetical protein